MNVDEDGAGRRSSFEVAVVTAAQKWVRTHHDYNLTVFVEV